MNTSRPLIIVALILIVSHLSPPRADAASCRVTSDGSSEPTCALVCDNVNGTRKVRATGVFDAISLTFPSPDSFGLSLSCGGVPDCTATAPNFNSLVGNSATCELIGSPVALPNPPVAFGECSC
jgi:hypothetical protein